MNAGEPSCSPRMRRFVAVVTDGAVAPFEEREAGSAEDVALWSLQQAVTARQLAIAAKAGVRWCTRTVGRPPQCRRKERHRVSASHKPVVAADTEDCWQAGEETSKRGSHYMIVSDVAVAAKNQVSATSA